MSIGWAFKLTPEYYVLMGIPLTTVFQLCVAKQPICRLWVRNSTSFHLPARGLIVAGVLLALGIRGAWRIRFPEYPWFVALLLPSVLGAPIASYAICNQKMASLRSALLPAVVSAAIGIGYFAWNSRSVGRTAFLTQHQASFF